MKCRPLFKTTSGRYYLSSWIVENFPKDYKDLEYCDVCCGGGSIFLNKDRSENEMINDEDSGIAAIYKALRDDYKDFIKRIKKVHYEEQTFLRAFERNQEKRFDDYYDFALNEFILRRMSRNGLKKSFAWTNRTRGGQPGDINAWETMIEQLECVGKRLQNVTVLNEKFHYLSSIWNEENVLLFVDAPSLPQTIDGTINEENNEMGVEKHVEFLGIIKDSKAKVIICGHDCVLYSKTLSGWKTLKKKVIKGRNKSKRQYSLWMNY